MRIIYQSVIRGLIIETTAERIGKNQVATESYIKKEYPNENLAILKKKERTLMFLLILNRPFQKMRHGAG